MKHLWLWSVCYMSVSLLWMGLLSSCAQRSITMATRIPLEPQARRVPTTSTLQTPQTAPASTSTATFVTSQVQQGIASWYGKEFHGRRTSNGEEFDMFKLTAAHKTAPLGIEAIVTNLDTGRSVHVRINDRGPFVGDRILDLSYAAAERLGMLQSGLARIKIRFLPGTIPLPTFIVQAGAYSDAGNAVRVKNALASQYQPIWVTVAQEDAKTFYRVRLGTFHSRTAAERVANQIQAIGYTTKVIPFTQPPPAVTRSADRL